jgi:hypothetical protein
MSSLSGQGSSVGDAGASRESQQSQRVAGVELALLAIRRRGDERLRYISRTMVSATNV